MKNKIKKVKYSNLSPIGKPYEKAVEEAALRVIRSGWYVLGSECNAFEGLLGSYLGNTNVVGCSNGLDALRLIFKALLVNEKLQIGDKVLVPANTYIASILPLSEFGLQPILIEPNPETFNLDAKQLRAHLNSEIKAVLLVHLYGRICWDEEIERILKEADVLVIEDNAQAIGAQFNGKMSGTLGYASAFSFYPGKNLGGYGDAGAVVTSDHDFAHMVRTLRNYGSEVKYQNTVKGYNCRLDELQAAILSEKLPYLERENQKRINIACRYIKEIKNEHITLPISNCEIQSKSNVWHIFPILTKHRSLLFEYLKNQQVETIIHYPIPPHKQKAYQEFVELKLPITERIHSEEISLPICPYLLEEEVDYVIEVMNRFDPNK